MKSALVCGAGGFIGSHLVKRLKKEGYWVRGIDLKYPCFAETQADDFVQADLRDPQVCGAVTERHFNEVYQLAADRGGAGYIFTGDNDADIMHNSAQINLNMLEACRRRKFGGYSILPQPAFTRNTTCLTRITPGVKKIRPTPPHRTANTAGRNCSVSAYTSLMAATMAWMFALPHPYGSVCLKNKISIQVVKGKKPQWLRVRFDFKQARFWNDSKPGNQAALLIAQGDDNDGICFRALNGNRA